MSQIGDALKKMATKMEAEKLAKSLVNLGVSVQYADGTFRPLKDILEDIADVYEYEKEIGKDE